MRIVALVLAVLAGVISVGIAVSAGTIGPATSPWRNISVLLPSALAAVGGIMCLNHPKAATYLLGAAALIFGLAENWLGLALVVAAGGIEFHFGRSPNT
jgi:hypothetical protein